MAMIDLHFPALGSELPTDHGYALYAALTRAAPGLHAAGWPLFIGPVPGQYAGRRRLRLPAENITAALPLAGKALEVGGQRLRPGVPQVRALEPVAALAARLVTIRGFTEPSAFLEAVRRHLDELGIAGEAGIPGQLVLSCPQHAARRSGSARHSFPCCLARVGDGGQHNVGAFRVHAYHSVTTRSCDTATAVPGPSRWKY
jgi:CRISPR-associated protein Cas6